MRAYIFGRTRIGPRSAKNLKGIFVKDIVTQTDIDVEQINPSLLPSVPLEGRSNLPEVSGIYFAVLQTGEILYIGKAVCIKRRWDNHHKFEEISPYKGARIAWFTYPAQTDEDLVGLEKECISHFKPVLNHDPKKSKRFGPKLRQTVYLEPDLHKQVRHHIADTGEDISDVVNLALRKLLENT